jgi:hypothetical protein
MPRRADAGDTRGLAFGLNISAAFRFPGLLPAIGSSPVPSVALHLVPRSEILAAWPDDATMLLDERGPDGRPSHVFATHPDAGHLLHARGWGIYLIAPGAHTVACAPTRQPTWRWQRYLVGQVLPFLAVLHRYEVLHASVVSNDRRAIALVGPSGAGKSTLAAELALRGWHRLADDVLVAALDTSGRVIAHRAVALTNLRHDAASRLGARAVDRLGAIIGSDDEALRIAAPLAPDAVALDALYLLDRATPGPAIERLRPVDPKLLLGATFNLVIRTPERLSRQLDVCQAIAATVDVTRVATGSNSTPAQIATLLEADTTGRPVTVCTP